MLFIYFNQLKLVFIYFFFKIEENKENKDPTNETQNTESKETILDESVLEIMGEDPKKSQYAELEIHPTFLKRWHYWIQKGVLDKDKEELLKKYKRPSQMEAPILNPEIVASIGEYACKRDGYRKNTQQLTVKTQCFC